MDLLLLNVDAIAGNALRWAAYRQALLDVPQQVGFPHDVVGSVNP